MKHSLAELEARFIVADDRTPEQIACDEKRERAALARDRAISNWREQKKAQKTKRRRSRGSSIPFKDAATSNARLRWEWVLAAWRAEDQQLKRSEEEQP